MAVKRQDLEHKFQSSIFEYVDKALPALRKYMFANANGGKRNIVVATKLKKEGVTSGVWDIFISIPNLYKHGLYLECKAGKNSLTEKQKEFAKNVWAIGYECYIIRTLEDFQHALCYYFGLERLTNNEIISRVGSEAFVQEGFVRNGFVDEITDVNELN